MSSYISPPKPPAPRAVRFYSTQSDWLDWIEQALQDLLDREIVAIDGVIVDGRKLDPHASTLHQMLRHLRSAGVNL